MEGQLFDTKAPRPQFYGELDYHVGQLILLKHTQCMVTRIVCRAVCRAWRDIVWVHWMHPTYPSWGSYVATTPDNDGVAVMEMFMPRSIPRYVGRDVEGALWLEAISANKPKMTVLLAAHTASLPMKSAWSMAINGDRRLILNQVLIPATVMEHNTRIPFGYMLVWAPLKTFIWYCETYSHCKDLMGDCIPLVPPIVELDAKIAWMHASGYWNDGFWYTWWEHTIGFIDFRDGEEPPYDEQKSWCDNTVATAIVRNVLRTVSKNDCDYLRRGDHAFNGVSNRALHELIRPWCSCPRQSAATRAARKLGKHLSQHKRLKREAAEEAFEQELLRREVADEAYEEDGEWREDSGSGSGE
jgi:hypothetical protein